MKKRLLALSLVLAMLLCVVNPVCASDTVESGVETYVEEAPEIGSETEEGKEPEMEGETGSGIEAPEIGGETEAGEEDETGGENEHSTPSPKQPSTPGTKKRVKVLMIGSSFTYRMSKDNYTIPYLKKLAKSGKKKFSVTKCIGSGASMTEFSSKKTSLGKKTRRMIKSKKWDYVVLQVSCYRAVHSPGAQKKGLVTLAKYIHKVNKKAVVVYDCTWAHNYTSGSMSSSEKYKRMMSIYNYAYKKTKAYSVRCQSGKAFNECKKHKNLFIRDHEHPNRYGAMLHAACLYATFFKTSPTKAKYAAGLNKKTVAHLKRVADKYCLNVK